jgi:hypothetical protein
MTTTIPGVGPVPVSQTEYTSGEVVKTYQTNMELLASIFNKRQNVIDAINQHNLNFPNAPIPVPSLATGNDLDTLASAVSQLTNLLHKGEVSGTPPNTYVSYLPQDTALKLGLVLQSLQAVGITSNLATGSMTDASKLALLQQWQSLAGVGVEQVIQNALTLKDTAPTRTLQSMIELEYVKQGNDIIFTHLGSLEDALRTTQNLLDTLGTIQSISNQVTAPTPEGFNLDFVPGTPAGFPSDYKAYASAYFRFRSAIPTPTSTAAQDLLRAKDNLKTQLALIMQQTQNASATNSLGAFVANVIRDISAVFVGADLNDKTQLNIRVSAWILDHQNAPLGTPDAVLAGKIQDNLTQAIQSAQSLNDTQKEDVRRFLFIFEEFYKSSSAVLQKITQIVEKMAQGISR